MDDPIIRTHKKSPLQNHIEEAVKYSLKHGTKLISLYH